MTDPRVDILYVITDLKLGGVPLHLHRLAVAMGERGWRPAVVALGELGPAAAMLREAQIPVETCAGGGGWDFRVVGRLARIIRRIRPGLVHAFLFHGNLAARLAAQACGFPWGRVICEIQTVEVERRWHLAIERWTHSLSRFTIGNSPSVVEHLAVCAGVPRGRLRLVRGGIDPASIRDAKPIEKGSLGLKEDARVVLWVGRLDPVKGLDHLLAAFERVRKEGDVHLLLAGEGPFRDHLELRIRSRALSDGVHLLGARRDVASLLKIADVFVFPSRTEGLPNALLEAMAAGCPIVTTDVPGCRDLIADGRTGLIVPYGDTMALAFSLQRLLVDGAEARRLGAAAAREVSERWHLSRTFERYAEVYAEARDAEGSGVAGTVGPAGSGGAGGS